jgi:hypothetical protein
MGRTGGDASIQRGGFYAAAPWHGVQATPSPVRALPLVGWWRWPGRRSRRRRPTRLARVSPRRAGETVVKVRFSCGHQNGPRSRQSTRLRACSKSPPRGLGRPRAWPFWAGVPRLVVPPVSRRAVAGWRGGNLSKKANSGSSPGFPLLTLLGGQPPGSGTGFSRGHRRAGLRRPGYRAVLPAGGAGFRFFLRREETEKAHLGESPAFSPIPVQRGQPHDSL